MGKQYKALRDKDKEFISQQKLFYIASASENEVNLSPKGYDTIQVLSENTLVFLDYPGSGNRTYRDAINDGEFTLLFNSFEEKAMILRLFCKARVVENESEDFYHYLEIFNEKESLVRNFFIFEIYALESSCGEGIPYMEYKGDRDSLKNWVVKMDETEKLETYKKAHSTPPNIKNL
ncbi:MAG: pyridoxamine 5'-phosphate oxidase family protein [Helicobacteraceae bacterium]|nr:pyridoxamine 5'-phosphate oxidase family protein [Candidatus Sulfurimonas ponti]MBL6973055.1 pyridoxamine 5'-phosphate oxidase family protein [Sulfurimonas sp.]